MRKRHTRQHVRASALRRAAAFTAMTGIVAVVVAGAACGASKSPRPASSNTVQVPVHPPGRIGYAASGSSATLQRLIGRNLDPAVSLPETLLANRLAAWQRLPVGERLTRWARLFAERDDNVYLFGVKPGGYVAESLLVQDYKLDCVSLYYRCSELARATTPREALEIALATRFAGGALTQIARPTGAVDYNDPSHLDYSEDMLRTGHWGKEVTREVGHAEPDRQGSSRYQPGSYSFIPKARLRYDRLQSGDLLYFVLDEKNEKAKKLRDEYGLLVGHQGIVDRDGDTVYLIHAAQSDLPGLYTGNRVVRVPLRNYLERVERFKGVFVSRLEEAPKTP